MVIQHLFSASIGLAIIIIALILGKKKLKAADFILVLWLLIFVINFLSLLLLNRKEAMYQTWEFFLFEFSEASIFLHGPLLYFYTVSLTTFSFRFRREQLFHLIPFIFSLVALYVAIITSDGINNTFRNILLAGKMISLLVYAIIVLRILYSHKNRVEDIFSNTEEKYLNWLFVISWGILIVWTISTLSLLVDRLTTLQIPQFGGLLTNIAISFFVFIMGYFGIRQPTIFIEASEGITKKRKIKYQKSGLSDPGAKKVYQSLLKLMQEKKPYLEPDLTLFALSGMIEIPPNHLSQVINSLAGKNFFDFINYYRVEEAKRNINSENNDHLTLLGIGFESGFNSKASFNRAFKKQVGITPSEYKKLDTVKNST